MSSCRSRMAERSGKALVERWISAIALIRESLTAMKDFKPFEVIRMSDPLRYQNLKWIARWNGSLCLLLGAGMMLVLLFNLLEGSVAIWEFLVLETLTGGVLFYVLRLWRWGWRKD